MKIPQSPMAWLWSQLRTRLDAADYAALRADFDAHQRHYAAAQNVKRRQQSIVRLTAHLPTMNDRARIERRIARDEAYIRRCVAEYPDLAE